MNAPGTLTLGAARGGLEVRQFFREWDSVIFTLSLPVVLLVMLGSILDFDVDGVSGGQLLAASILAGGVASATFVNLGTGIATERDDGTLKRLRAGPLPATSYFLGKVLLVLFVSLVETLLLLAVGVMMFDLELPAQADRWLTFSWVFLLGVTSCSLLGIAASSLARSARSAGAVMNLPFIVLQFISGIYILPISMIPSPLREIGAFFPLKWMAQGFRSVFLPDGAAASEAAGAWELGRTALVLGLWTAAGLALCLTTFRWRSRMTR